MRLISRYRLSFLWVDLSKLQHKNNLLSNTFKDWREYVPEKLY